ncbi:hypothetical protein TPE_0004 [Treponema pedis str. T A4]|uniref:Uncharacterized protein n=1 Tax=Treponema pedis str. T A4 TaxID=1291379 RepID=S5ZJ10_9SPIR|nr:hypothetical protein TPE_0004 [Treponema pedis str. T A4]
MFFILIFYRLKEFILWKDKKIDIPLNKKEAARKGGERAACE